MRMLGFLLLVALVGCYKPESECYPLGHEKNPLVMAFVPSTEAEKVIASGDELAALLVEHTGLHFKAFIVPSYVSVVEAMAVGKVHIGWLPPMAYVFAHQRNGDRALLKVVRDGKATYRGQILVMADSGIDSIADLAGKRLAFTEQASASGHLYPRALLLEHGIDLDLDLLEVFYSGSHDAAVLALVKGSVDAACSYDDAREKLAQAGIEDIMETTRVLAYTPDIPADNVTVISELDDEMASAISDALLAIAASDRGKEVLMELYEIEGLVPASDADYLPVRKMAAVLGLDVEEEVEKAE
ncbi:phosphate/phosphite/phosphonate ABC transporter substrate-binding protein [bacterium]|nr:phosphate/phosphite/phosphonate ABC transporter substrate-binding protein [bacterium]